jgi:hypothetical protein
MIDRKFSKSELKVRAIARRRANAQLMRVPWSRFQKAYEEYPRWQALALWIQAVSAAQDSVPSSLIGDLRKRCQGFIKHGATSHWPKVTGLNLLEWAHNHRFSPAKRQGWLDALIFYGVRHPRSQAAWAYWEHCDEEWNRQPLSRYTHFEEWLQSATTYEQHAGKSVADLASAVDRYVEWRIFCRWLEPLIKFETEPPKNIASELERRCPEILELNSSNSTRSRYMNAEVVRHLIARVEDRFFGEAEKEDWIDMIRRHVPTHPLYVRVAQYSKHFTKISAQDLAKYPSYARWRRIVENYKEE